MKKRIINIILALTLPVFLTSFHFSDNEEDSYHINKVVIDAGHGGKDVGCQGAVSNEKDVALSISLKLGKYIEENFKDVEVIYTRKTDKFVELHERASIANRNDADLFICVHANAGPTSAYGTETYVMGLHRSEANLKVAKRENSSILMEEDYKTEYEDFDPKSAESYIAISLMQSAFLDQSLKFAAKVQEQFRERVGRHDRGVKQAGFLVLYRTTMPSVLIETGFLTNEDEEKFLNSDIGQDYLASGIFRAFREYKSEIESKYESNAQVAESQDESGITEKKSPKSTVIDGKKLTFKVQIATSASKRDVAPENFNGLKGVSIYEAGGLYRYVIGKEASFESAERLQQEVRESGYKDAFIVAFHGEKRIAVGEALKMLE